MRLVVMVFFALVVSTRAWATPPNTILKAKYTEPTTRYDHGILGDAVEWGALVLTVDVCEGCQTKQIRKFTIRLPENRVFEDLAPRIILDEFGRTYVMVVETDLNLGARLAIYSASGLEFSTPFIGRTHRWLAPVGAADLNGDGIPEIAYVEKPHLSKELKVWQFDKNGLTFLTSLKGLTNHRIGQDFISSGIRDCGDGPEIITADANWRNVMATRLVGGSLSTRSIAVFKDASSIATALACEQ